MPDYSDPIPLKEAAKDNPEVQKFLDDLTAGKVHLCACMGPMYGEPECPCRMDRLGLPKNEEARAEAMAYQEEQIKSLTKWLSRARNEEV